MTRLQQRCLLISLAVHGAVLGALALAALVTASRKPVERPTLVFDLQREPATGAATAGPAGQAQPRSPVAPRGVVTTAANRTTRPTKAPAGGGERVAVARVNRNTPLSAQALAPVLRPRAGAGQGNGTGNPAIAAAGTVRTAGTGPKVEESHPVEVLATNIASGGSGLGVESYAGQVRAVYAAAWLPPEELTDPKAVAEVEVVVKRDGSVVSAEILTGSRNALMDRSVRQALNEVQFIREFPAGWREEQKTFRIRFDLSVREQLLAG